MEGTVARWVERAHKAAFVATSRERLKLAGEEVLPLEPLPVEREGVELFAERARAQRPAFALSDANRQGAWQFSCPPSEARVDMTRPRP